MNKHIIGKYIVNKCIRYISMMFMAVVILFNFTPKAEAAEWIWAGYGYLSTVESSTVGADGRIWFCGYSSEIAGYTKDNIISSGVWPHGKYTFTNTIVSDLDGNIWAGGVDGSVACWRNTGGWFNTGHFNGSRRDALASTRGLDGKIWMGGKLGELAYWNGSGWTKVNSWTSTSNITSLLTDSAGNIWAASEAGELACYNGSTWINKGQWIYDNTSIIAIKLDLEGNIWATGSEGKIAYYNGSNWISIPSLPHASDYAVNIAVSPDNKIWAANGSMELYFWENEKWNKTPAWPYTDMSHSGANYMILSVEVDSEGDVWASGKDGRTAYLSLHLENSMGEVRSMAEQAQIQASNAVAQATTNYDLLTNTTYGLSAIKAKLDNTYTRASNANTNATNAVAQATTNYDLLTNTTYGLSAIKAKLDNTYTRASNANTNATNAVVQATANNDLLTNTTYGLSAIKTKLNNTYTNATNAATRTWDPTEGKSAATLAKEARDKSNEALTEINTIKTTIDSIKSSIAPVITKTIGLNGATCTKTSIFTVTIQASGADEYRAKLDSGSWTVWGTSKNITLGGLTNGAHTINVQARNSNGVVAESSMVVFKL
jgi:hypothetical protein